MFAKLIFKQQKGAATDPQDPMPAWQMVQGGQGGPGRGAVMCQEQTLMWNPNFTASLSKRTSQHIPPERTQCASPWRLSVITSLATKCYQVLLALPRLVNIFSTYRGSIQDKTKASLSICFSQVSHTSLQSSQPSVHEVLTNYLIVLPLRHAIIFASALAACDISRPHSQTINLSWSWEHLSLFFSLSSAQASFSLQFLPEKCSQVFSVPSCCTSRPGNSALFCDPHPFSSASRPYPVWCWCP